MYASMVAFCYVAAICGTHSFWSFSRIWCAFFGGHKHLSQTPLHFQSWQMLWHTSIVCMYTKCMQVWWLSVTLRLFAGPTHFGHFHRFRDTCVRWILSCFRYNRNQFINSTVIWYLLVYSRTYNLNYFGDILPFSLCIYSVILMIKS